MVSVIGIAISGIAGSVLELLVGARLSFAAPFFTRMRWPLSILAVVLAGPFMLANDALDARRDGRIGPLQLLCIALSSGIWVFFIGQAMVGSAANFIAF